MKSPRPLAPINAPSGTKRLGGEMNWFSAALLVSGEDLCPDLVTELIGEPCEQQTKGVPLLKGDGSILRVPKFGRWSRTIRPEDTDEWDVGEVIKQLFAGLPEATHVWSKVASLGNIQVSLGLSMTGSNREFGLDAEVTQLLASRHATAWFDVHFEEQGVDSGRQRNSA